MRTLPLARAPSCPVLSSPDFDTSKKTGPVSRRSLFGVGASALLLSKAAWGQQFSTEAPATSEANSVAARTDADRHMTIEVAINGRGPYRFVVDTGADRSVLSDTVAMELGLQKQNRILVEGVVRTVPAETVRLDEVAFGVVRKTDIVVPVLPRGWLGADGYLGLDMIGDYRVTFDFRGHRLSVEEPRSPWLLGNDGATTEKLAATGAHGRLRVLNCRIDGVTVSVFVDTGAEISMANPALFEALIERNPAYSVKALPIMISGVTGGDMPGRVIDFGRLKIRDIAFTNGTLAVANLQIFELWDLASRPALLIGMNFLRQFNRFSIDYRRHTFSFDVSRAEMFYAQRERRLG